MSPPQDTTNPLNDWNKLDTNNQLSDWDKLDESQPLTNDTWDFDRSKQNEQIESTPGEDIWNKFFDEIWSKVLKSASSIWDKVVAEITRLSKKY